MRVAALRREEESKSLSRTKRSPLAMAREGKPGWRGREQAPLPDEGISRKPHYVCSRAKRARTRSPRLRRSFLFLRGGSGGFAAGGGDASPINCKPH